MTVPQHEKPEDRLMETMIATAYCTERGYDRWKKHSPLDPFQTPDIYCYAFGSHVSGVEIRRRYDCKKNSFKDWAMEDDKIKKMLALSATCLPFFVFAWDDVFGYLDPLKTPPVREDFITRKVMRTTSDKEWAGFYSKNDFIRTWNRANYYPKERPINVNEEDIPLEWYSPDGKVMEKYLDSAWVNPYPFGTREAWAETRKVVMMAMREGREFTPEETEAIREMYKQVMAGEKKLVYFWYLVNRVAPPEPVVVPEPVPEVEKAENCDLFT